MEPVGWIFVIAVIVFIGGMVFGHLLTLMGQARAETADVRQPDEPQYPNASKASIDTWMYLMRMPEDFFRTPYVPRIGLTSIPSKVRKKSPRRL